MSTSTHESGTNVKRPPPPAPPDHCTIDVTRMASLPDDMRAAALLYGDLGLRVVPLYGIRPDGRCTCADPECDRSRGKHPAINGWQEKATPDASTIGGWPIWATSNIGLALGGPERLIALDIDGSAGRESLEVLEMAHGPLPDTLASKSGREDGGEHLIFWLPPALDLSLVKNRSGQIAPGLDIRATGGQIAVAPSLHKSGARYRWTKVVPIATCPSWLYKKASASKDRPAAPPPLQAPRPRSGDREERYVSAALDGACQAVRTAPEGQRNDTLNREALGVAGLTLGGELDHGRAWAALADAARQAGLGEVETQKTLASAFKAATPRKVPESDRRSSGAAYRGDEEPPPPGDDDAPPSEDGDQPEPEPEPGCDDEPATAAATWPAPQPLPAVLMPVKPVTPDMLPASLRPWLVDIAERTGTPLEFAATTALIALGAAIGRDLAIQPKRHDDFEVSANLWGCIIGRPGTLKSPAQTMALAPLRRVEMIERQKWEEEQAKINSTFAKAERAAKGKQLKERLSKAGDNAADLEKLKAEFQQLEEEEQEANLPQPRAMVTDCTIEKLGMLLKDHPRGLLHYRDELTGWLRQMEREGHQSDRQFYLEGWNRNEYRVDRVGRGELFIPCLWLALAGTIQPGPLAEVVRSAHETGNGDDGLVQRFQLMVYPDLDPTRLPVDRPPNRVALDYVHRVFEAARTMAPRERGALYEDPLRGIAGFLKFDEAAQAIWTEWYMGLEVRVRTICEPPYFTAHIGKYRSLVPQLALVLHIADQVLEPYSINPIPPEPLRLALRWAEVLESHARRVYAGVVQSPAHLLAEKLTAGAMGERFRERDVLRSQWAGLKDQDAVHQALEQLVQLGWLRAEKRAGKGRPTTDYVVNPAVRKS